MNWAYIWTVWFWFMLGSFAVLETWAGMTKGSTLSQITWGLEDSVPWVTWSIVVGMVAIVIHLGGHRILDFSWLIKLL